MGGDDGVEGIGEARFVRERDWAEIGLSDDRAGFEDALRRMGLAEEILADALAVRDDARAYSISPIRPGPARYYGIDGPHDAMVARRETRRAMARERLLDWLAGRQLVTEATATQTVDIPIFVLDSPAVDGCSTTLTRSTTSEDGAGWTLELAGSGFTGSRTIATTLTSTVSSRAGHAKLIFQPVVVEVSLVALHEKGQVTGRGLQVVPIGTRDLPPPGATDSRTAGVVRAGPPIDFRLGGDTSEDTSEYTFTYETSSGLGTKVGIAAFGAKADLAVTRRLQRSFTLTAELVAGRDYSMRPRADIDGIRWEATTPR